MLVRLTAFLVLAAQVVLPEARAELSLGELRSKFELAVDEEDDDHAARSRSLREGYVGALSRLKRTLGKEGKLEQAAHILLEEETLETGGELRPLPQNADYRLKNLRKKWRDNQGKVDAARKEKIGKLAKVYLKLLEQRKESMTRAGEIRKALVVEEEMKRVRSSEEVMSALVAEARGSLVGSLGEGNLALQSNGAKAKADNNAAAMIDGVVEDYGTAAKYCWGNIPCELQVELPEVYVISKVRMLLYDLDGRQYRYLVEVSPDGETWKVVDDQSGKLVKSGWRDIGFEPTDVRFVRLKGLENTVGNGFHVVELEVYSPEDQ